jgi:hypothetical protein
MVFNLYAIEGYKHQITSMLGINEGTSKSQLSHARKMLQGQINKLKITVMEPNKLEKQFKEQLNSRNSAFRNGLGKLDAMLAAADSGNANRRSKTKN